MVDQGNHRTGAPNVLGPDLFEVWDGIPFLRQPERNHNIEREITNLLDRRHIAMWSVVVTHDSSTLPRHLPAAWAPSRTRTLMFFSRVYRVNLIAFISSAAASVPAISLNLNDSWVKGFSRFFSLIEQSLH